MQVDISDVYKTYAKRLYLFIYHKCQDKELAEDVVQTAFLKAIENIERFRDECSIYSWISKIALNVLYAEWKRTENRNVSLDLLKNCGEDFSIGNCIGDTSVFDSQETNDPLISLIREEESEELYRRIDRLKKLHREIVLLRLHNVPFKEIGLHFNRSENWAKVNYHRAVKKMQKMREVHNDRV